MMFGRLTAVVSALLVLAVTSRAVCSDPVSKPRYPRVLVLGFSGCGHCEKMRRDSGGLIGYEPSGVAQYVDALESDLSQYGLKREQFDRFPTTLVLDGPGEPRKVEVTYRESGIIRRREGLLTRTGYMDRKQFQRFMRRNGVKAK